MPESRPPAALPATRRTAIAGAALLGLSGCRWGPADSASPSEPEPDADAALITRAAGAIADVRRLVDLTRTGHLGLSGALVPLLTLHDSHLALLGADTAAAGHPTVPGRSAAALARVRARERQLQEQLAALALEAVSGTFARALASMSAAVAQQLAVLPDLPTRGPA